MLVQAIEEKTIKGALLRMGNSIRDIDIKAGHHRDQQAYDAFQADQEVALALAQPTALTSLTNQLFDRIERHGYEIADATLTTHSPQHFPTSLTWAEAS